MGITFLSHVSQIILCASAALFFDENKTKSSGKYAYLVLFLVTLNIIMLTFVTWSMACHA